METEKIKNIKSKYFTYEYGIEFNTPITLNHIMSLVFYTDYTVLSTIVSSTFRRLNNETDNEWKNRHSQFANIARLLRESVENIR